MALINPVTPYLVPPTVQNEQCSNASAEYRTKKNNKQNKNNRIHNTVLCVQYMNKCPIFQGILHELEMEMYTNTILYDKLLSYHQY